MSQANHAKVLHRGRVVKISGDTVYVEINPDESDCGGCTLRGSCNSRSRQLVQVPVRDACTIPQMNQEVTVAATAGPQNAATLLMTFPLVAFIAATVVLSIVGIDHSLAVLGGCLADYVFEPFMGSGNGLAGLLGAMVGNAAGSGMAAMFLCTGICGFAVSVLSCFNREIRKLN